MLCRYATSSHAKFPWMSMSISFWFIKRKPIIFCNYSGWTVKNSHNFKGFWCKKQTISDLKLKTIHFVSEIIFEDLMGNKKG